VRYLLAILLPPVAILSVGKPFQAILCLILMITVIGWPIAVIWALFVVNSAFADARTKKLLEEARRQTAILEAQAQTKAEPWPQAEPQPQAPGEPQAQAEPQDRL